MTDTMDYHGPVAVLTSNDSEFFYMEKKNSIRQHGCDHHHYYSAAGLAGRANRNTRPRISRSRPRRSYTVLPDMTQLTVCL